MNHLRSASALALALVTASGCGEATSSGAGAARGMGEGTFTVTLQNGEHGNAALRIKGGRVYTADLAIDCGVGADGAPLTSCSSTFPLGTTVVLNATASGNDTSTTPVKPFLFLGWAGDCSGEGACTLTGNSDKYVVAIFAAERTGHPNYSDPSVHGPAWAAHDAGAPGALNCEECHGARMQGNGIAVGCAACHEWPHEPTPPSAPTDCRELEAGTVTIDAVRFANWDTIASTTEVPLDEPYRVMSAWTVTNHGTRTIPYLYLWMRIEQDAASRAAGGGIMLHGCGEGIAALGPGTCAEPTWYWDMPYYASNDQPGDGQLVPGPAMVVASIICQPSPETTLVTESRVPVTLVARSPVAFTIGGSVSGLEGSGLVLSTAGLPDLEVSAGATSFAFAVPLATGNAYAVSVKGQPVDQVCSVSNDRGTVGTADVASVVVTCARAGGGAHAQHAFTSCSTCHHRGEAVEFDPGGAAVLGWPEPPPAFSPEAKTCSNVACHGVRGGTFGYWFPGPDGEPQFRQVERIAGPFTAPSWYTAGPSCAACHGNPPQTGSTGNGWHSGTHAGQDSTGPANQCQFCHPNTYGENGVGTLITDPALHRDGVPYVWPRWTSTCFGCH